MSRRAIVLLAFLCTWRPVHPLSLQPPAWVKVAQGLQFDSPAASAGVWLAAGEADDAAEHLGVATAAFDNRLATIALQVDGTGATAFRRLVAAPPGASLLTAAGWAPGAADAASQPPVEYSAERRAAWLARFPSRDAAAAAATHRWAAAFVAPLNLCPWAAAALASPGASRTVVAAAVRTKDEFATAVVLAAAALLARWEEGKEGRPEAPLQLAPDPTTAISFVVAPAFDLGFEDFYDFLVELEDEVLPDAFVPDELLQGCLAAPAKAPKGGKNKAATLPAAAADRKPPFPVPELVDEDGVVYRYDNDEEEDWADLRLGDVVTMAGFHPDWRYGAGSDPATDWEKRAPHPTVSLVLTAGLGGESATERVAAANAATLGALGSEEAAALFQKAVLHGSGGQK